MDEGPENASQAQRVAQPAEVVVVGSINVDLLLTVRRHPRPGETLIGGGGMRSPGGKGANQAVAAALRGASTAMVGAVGDDGGAEVALSRLEDAFVDLGDVVTVPGPTGLAVVTLDDDGENTIVVVPGANAWMTPDVVERASDTVRAARVCVLQGEIPRDSIVAVAATAAAAGVRVVLNAAPALDLPRATLAVADPLVVNEHEAALVLGWAGGGEATAGESGASLADRLHALGAPSVVVTLGAAGAVGVSAGGAWAVDGLRVPVVDTTGAGDAFVGALAASLARGDGLQDAAREATRVAAHSVQRHGAQDSYPGPEVELP
ncbi:ribokinase [Litorihabitans aurantiacus]|uniref:Ribokinase n=1 Tax=Litorihabitans aurantiacus TaxID=1930061 RepID=A0AA37XGQ1_9MICO|nr:ribokinase [Litorihabitans aurantiacus]GMA32495.1 ribokinase [Litorihabitans aurantiacus]